MKNKILRSFFLLLLIPSFSFAQKSFSDSYKPGDKLYVYSREGLSLREKADPKGKLLVVAPYGDEVVVLQDTEPRIAFTSSNIAGAWVKVKSKEKIGYMFNGFLSRLKPMPNSNEARYREDFYNYLKAQFTFIKETKTPPEKIYVDYLKMELASGATYEEKDYEGGTTIITRFPINTITFQETFLLARIAYGEFFVNKKCDYNPDNVECEGEENQSIQIKKDGNFYAIIYGFAD